eukprot:TRINITY_DN62836_c0_g1_i1.p1 TRINITY_DN62836_c0_g1~~TRINITY_DN62836_c0_g1_i1.p1  ORF type:complete len:291 (-),score=59.89 TRINITY_DN62836_c0_g1_i1:60-869(-)
MSPNTAISSLQATLKTEIGRVVQHGLRFALSDGDPKATEEVGSLVTHAQLAWDELMAVSQPPSQSRINAALAKWCDLLEAKHRRLIHLSRELDSAEWSFLAAKKMCARETEYLRSLGFDENGDDDFSDLPQNDEEQETQHLQDLEALVRCEATMRGEANLERQANFQADEITSLRVQLADVMQTRQAVQDRQNAELAELYRQLEEAGVKLTAKDYPNGVRPRLHPSPLDQASSSTPSQTRQRSAIAGAKVCYREPKLYPDMPDISKLDT